MGWQKAEFEELVTRIRESLKGAVPSTGVPFFIYVYDPKEEARCIRNFHQLSKSLQSDGYSVQVIMLGQVMARVLKSLPYLTPEGKTLESKNREALRVELSRVPGGLPDRVANVLLKGINGIFEGLQGSSQDRCAILLRAGALFPFVHVSQLLNRLENRCKWTTVFAFPGSRDPHAPEVLRFLNETEGSYYRATVIGWGS